MPGTQSVCLSVFVITFLHYLWWDASDSLSFNLEFHFRKPKHDKLILLYRLSAEHFANPSKITSLMRALAGQPGSNHTLLAEYSQDHQEPYN